MMKAVIPAAGLGTRFLPISRVLPKEMLPIGSVPSIEYAVNEALDSNCKPEDIIIVINDKKKIIKDYLGDEFSYAWQDEPRGLGDAILMAKSQVKDENFFVLLPDDVFLPKGHMPACAQLYAKYTSKNLPAPMVIGTQLVEENDVQRYGICILENGKFDQESVIVSIVEKPESYQSVMSRVAVVGRYMFPKGFMSCIEKTKPGKNGEIQLSDAINLHLKKDKCFGICIDGMRYDIGTPSGWLQANVDLSKWKA
jgi:UTP--glucose-1-phosphate uridylyltransferase